MKDPHGRIARWFILQAKYDIDIIFRARRQNASADYLSWPVEVLSVMDNAAIESDVKLVGDYLNCLYVRDHTTRFRKDIKIPARYFLLHEDRLYRRT